MRVKNPKFPKDLYVVQECDDNDRTARWWVPSDNLEDATEADDGTVERVAVYRLVRVAKVRTRIVSEVK